ncbi:MAG: hypothetical protein EHM93_17565 [Bacteroidales bacterium]|nr:MAG: hypothetical protein EHM93_17565 [Bacteroidales bacterium]
MKKKLLINTSFAIATIVLLIWIALLVFIEPWTAKKIEKGLNETLKDYTISIGQVNVSLIKCSIELEKIKILPKDSSIINSSFIKGEIASIKFNRINLWRAVFKKDVVISEVLVSSSKINGRVPFPEKSFPPVVSPFNIRIDRILFDGIDLNISNSLNAQSFWVKNGILKVQSLQIGKQDTIGLSIANQLDFGAKEFFSVSSDSMYSYKINGINYSAVSKTLAIDSLSIHPNFNDYDFTSKYAFQTNRYETVLCNVFAYNMNAADYLESKSITSNYIEIGTFDLNVFRDKRKEFKHIEKATFQDFIYSYKGILNIDSIGLLSGNVKFKVHAEKANQPGEISFNEIHAKIYKITNDTIYKIKSADLALKADAMLMGKSKLTVLLESKLFDSNNTFTVNGVLAGLEVKDLNPILEKTAFIYGAGKIDAMNFSFTANNTKATGKLTILYHGLNVVVKNKRTDDTTAFVEKFVSAIANSIIIDSNPIQGEKVRVGIIDYKRDPERFLFNYCFKSILSGIESSLVKNPKK